MSQTLNNVKIILRGGTSTEWASSDPVLSVREVGVDSSFSPARFKIGDGVKKWSELAWAGTLVEASTTNGNIKVNGSEVTVYTLPSVGTAGTYTKVTTDANGRVTAGTNLSASDIPTITLSKISDAGTAASKNVGTAAGNVVALDSNGKLPEGVLPSLSIVDVYTVASTAEMVALNAQKGDMAIVGSDTYILSAAPASTLANWVKIPHPTDVVQAVNGKTGVVVLTTSDVAEGTNLYYTQARFDSAFAAKSVRGLSDGAKVVTTDDDIILNCGTP
jgi:hypothetical protein